MMKTNKITTLKPRKLFFAFAINTSLVLIGGFIDSSFASSKLNLNECSKSLLPEASSLEITSQKCNLLGFLPDMNMEGQREEGAINDSESEKDSSSQTISAESDETSPSTDIEEDIDLNSEGFDGNESTNNPESIPDDYLENEGGTEASLEEEPSGTSVKDLIFNLTEKVIDFGIQKLRN